LTLLGIERKSIFKEKSSLFIRPNQSKISFSKIWMTIDFKTGGTNCDLSDLTKAQMKNSYFPIMIP